MSTLIERLRQVHSGASAEPPKPVVVHSDAPVPSFPTKEQIAARFQRTSNARPEVRWSAELARVLAIPRRDLATTYTQKDFEDLERSLRRTLKPGEKCRCAEMGRACPTNLKPIQALALLEARANGGALLPIGVGHGKELTCLLMPMVIPGVKTAVLMTQGNLKAQLLGKDGRPGDYDYYGGHWNLPYLAGSQWFRPGPALHVYTYDQLSRQSGTDLLRKIDPDLFVLNESHNIKPGKNGKPSTRAQRFFSFATADRPAGKPPLKFVFASGSMLRTSIKDYAPHAALALGDERNPLPNHKPTLEEWAGAVDPDVEGRAPPGALLKLCEPGEDVQDGFRRRRNDTPGVVASSHTSIPTSLVISVRPLQLPTEQFSGGPDLPPLPLSKHIDNAHAGMRPDGEEAQDVFVSLAWAWQLSAGFFHRWRYPRGEPAELIDEWFRKRKANNREIRQRLKDYAEPHLDSPGLIENAARRFYTPRMGKPTEDARCPGCLSAISYPDECVACGAKVRPDPAFGSYARGRAKFSAEWDGAPVWAMPEWLAWSAIEDLVQPEPQAVWLSDFMVNDAAAWAREAPGIVWVAYPELGHRIAKAAGIPYFGGGEKASDEIRAENGKRSIVASMKAHGTGKNLQQFARNLVCNPCDDWEQLIGRTHRIGQLAAEVTVELYQHTEDYRNAFSRARELAAFKERTEGAAQKLCFASYAD